MPRRSDARCVHTVPAGRSSCACELQRFELESAINFLKELVGAQSRMLAELAVTDPAIEPAANAKLVLIAAPQAPAQRSLRLVTSHGDEPPSWPKGPPAHRSTPTRED